MRKDGTAATLCDAINNLSERTRKQFWAHAARRAYEMPTQYTQDMGYCVCTELMEWDLRVLRNALREYKQQAEKS